MTDLNQHRRRHQRYEVYWEALLELETDEFHRFIPVPLVNMSQSGVLFYTESMTCNNCHLTVAARNHQLNLIINTPAKALDSKIAVRRYSWDDEKQAFAVGAEFSDESQISDVFGQWLEKQIRQDQRPVIIPDECMMHL